MIDDATVEVSRLLLLRSQSKRRSLRFTRLAVRTLLVVAAAGLLGTPFVVLKSVHSRQSTTATQQLLPAPAIPPAQLAKWQDTGADLPANAPPIVLAYHDVQPSPPNRYVVTPQQLDSDLTAIRTAGYQIISSAEYLAYLRGGAAAPRSVYLTFDDGTAGLWRYADPVLARHNAVASSYIITGRLDSSSYYLTWDAVEKMAKSGRWDFQSHTHDLHSRLATDAAGTQGSDLINLRWDSASRTQESLAEHHARVEADVDETMTDFSSHHLSKPQLFAYPFSEVNEPTNSTQALKDTKQVLASRFAGAFSNADAAPTSRRSIASGEIGRIEVETSTSPDALLDEIHSWTESTVGATHPLVSPVAWVPTPVTATKTLNVLKGSEIPTGGVDYYYSSFAPNATCDWTNYRVDADVTQLTSTGTGAAITVRVGSIAPITVRLSQSRLELVDGTGNMISQNAITARTQHHVEIAISPTFTTAAVDAGAVFSIPNLNSPETAGGIAIAGRRTGAAAVPTFVSLSVAPLT